MHLGYVDQVAGLEMPPELRSVGRFALQVQFAMNDAVVFSHDFDRPEASTAV